MGAGSRTCSKCQAALDVDAKFCDECGTPVAAAASPAEPTAPAEPATPAPPVAPPPPIAPEPVAPSRRLSSRPRSRLVTAGLATAITALVICWIPFLGYLGLIGAILGTIGLSKKPGDGTGMVVASWITGLLATTAAIIWTYVAATASCPHVYAWDGQQWRFDADLLSGSLYRAGESEDLDRLETLASVDGQYRLRVVNERPERDFVDRVALQVVDHPAGTEALPTQAGEIVVVGPAAAPSSARDARDRDRLPLLAAEDSLSWQGELADHDPDGPQAPREILEVTLPRPAGSAFLVLRARNTEQGTEALYRYLARIGPGLGPLLELAGESRSYPYRQRLDDEMDRLGVPLRVEIQTASGWVPAARVGPVGPGVLRSFAVPLAAGEGPVHLRLLSTPLAWEIDRVAIAGRAAEVQPQVLAPTRAARDDGEDVTAEVSLADARRVRVDTGHHVELGYAAPALVPGTVRSVFVQLRGYYEVDIGGRGLINPLALVQHHREPESAPRWFVRELKEARP